MKPQNPAEDMIKDVSRGLKVDIWVFEDEVLSIKNKFITPGID